MTFASRKHSAARPSIESDILGTGQLWRRAYSAHRHRREATALCAASIASAAVAAFSVVIQAVT
jgi:hypothetical protein